MPAAAVIHRSQALSGFTGRKESVAGYISLFSNTPTQSEKGDRYCISGSYWGLVEFPVERWNALISERTPKVKTANYNKLDGQRRKLGEQTGLDTPVVQAVNYAC